MRARANGKQPLWAAALGGALLALVAAEPAAAQKRPRAGRKPAATQSTPAAESVDAQNAPSTPEGDVAPQPSTPWTPPSNGAAGPSTTSAPTTPATPAAATGEGQVTGANDAAASAEQSPPPSTAETSAEPAPAPAVPAALSKDVATVMDELVQLRARTRVLGKALFKTKMQVRVENEAAPDQIAARLQLWLDGAPIWSGDGSGLRDPERVLFEGLAAPGPHVLTYEVEQRARDDEKYRYSQRASLRFVALRDRRMELVLVLEDDSDMAEDFDEDEEGEYDVRVQMQVSAHRLDE
jgi:hypothetical protein